MQKAFLLVFVMVLFSFSSVFPQLNFEENFDYPAGDTLTNHGWFNHSGTGFFITLSSGSLSYPGYPSSDIGNSVNIAGGSGSREDVTAAFNVDSVSNVYCSFLVNVASIGATPDYFFHFRENPVAAILRGRVFIRDNGAGGFNFGMSKGSTSSIDWDTTARNLSETYFIVLKYEYVPADSNDLIHLFVNPLLTGPEPATPNATNPDKNSDIIVNAVSIRQGSQTYGVQLDGIRVSNSWNDILPVELVSFNASANGSEVNLSWITATELNNSGFSIERKTSSSNWQSVGFVKGVGTTTALTNYNFIDKNILSQTTYSYRLKQIDFDGSFTYSKVVQVNTNLVSSFELNQNYPNPFNPSTQISFSLAQNGLVTLSVYNLLGQEVRTLINRNMEAGSHSITFDASGLQSGVYVYQLNAAGSTLTRKMMLVK